MENESPERKELELRNIIPKNCSICRNNNISYFGCKDFNYSCNNFFEKKNTFEESGINIHYYKCEYCNLIFTNAFDTWSYDDFITHIYNKEYYLCDSPFDKARPTKNANFIEAIFPYEQSNISFLDFGGGEGFLTKILKNKKYNIDNFDVIYDRNTALKLNSYDIVTSFEVIEHIPHSEQIEWLMQAKRFLNKEKTSKIIISTELSKETTFIDDWYISPRNGHITMHSSSSLKFLANKLELSIFSLSNTIHIMSK